MNEENVITSENRQKKEVIVAEISEKVGRATGLVFTNYQGLTHQQLEGFKKELKKANAEFAIVKNTLLKRTLADKELSDEDKDKFQQPTAALFMYGEVVEPLKSLAASIKANNLPSIKFGIIDGKVTGEADLIKLSSLPSKDVLRAQLLGMMKSPIQGLHRALTWNMQSLVMTLNAIKEQKA